MKKTLIGFLASLGCLACLAGCANEKTGDLEKAKDYIKELYKNAAVETGADYERVGTLKINGKEYTVVWTVDATEGVTVTQDADGNYLIDVDENAEADINYVLTGTIKDENGNSLVITYNHTVPKFKELTWAEFTATEDEKAVVIKGVISGIVNTDSKHELYLQDNDGGYYVYNLDAEKMTGLAVGQEIRVRGTRDTYYGVNQVIEADVEVLNETPVTVAATDITELFANAESLQAETLTAKQSMVVTIKGVTVLGQDASDTSYYNFSLGDKKSYVRISSSACMFGSADQTAFKNTVAANKGMSADVTGVVSIYNNKIYLIPLTKDAFSNFQLLERTDAEKIDFEANLMEGLADEVSKDVTLQTAGSLYSDVAIAWASSNSEVAKVEDGKLVITRPASNAEDATVTITATITCGEATAKTVEYTIVVPKALATVPLAISEAPVVGTKYKFYLEQGNLDKTLYFAGAMDGNYLAATDSQEEAADVEVVAVTGEEGKFYLFTAAGYITITANTNDEGKVSYYISLTRDATTKFVWDATNKTLVTEDNAAYIGTYNQFETFSASALSYIGTSFPARLCTLVDASEIPDEPQKPAYVPVEGVSNVVADTAYKFFVNQASLEQTLYITGEVSGRYLATTTDASAAADVYAEAATGGYKFYILVNNAKQYINIYNNTSNQVSVNFDAASTCVYTYVADTNIWKTTFNGTEYYLGTYSTFNTISASKTSYISADNTGVSQFPAGFVASNNEGGSGNEGGDTPTYSTPEEIVNAAYALAEGESLAGTYTLTGVVASVDDAYSTQYENVTVTIVVGNMTNKPIQCYRLKGTGADVIGKGDTVTVTGVLKNYYGTIEFDAGCTLDSYTDVPDVVDPDAASAVTLSFADKANRTTFTTSQQVWAQNGITVTNDKGSSTSNVADYASPARFYKSSKLTVACAGMTKIVFECANATYATALQSSIAASANYEVTVSGSSVTITFTEATDSFTIDSLSGGQVRVNEVKVWTE